MKMEGLMHGMMQDRQLGLSCTGTSSL